MEQTLRLLLELLDELLGDLSMDDMNRTHYQGRLARIDEYLKAHLTDSVGPHNELPKSIHFECTQ